MNRSKDLRKLFKTYMARKEEESKRPVNYHYGRSQEYYNEAFRDKQTFHGVIFFYEWSDITRDPIRYFSIPLFEKFLAESELVLEAWQRDVILNLQQVFITCRPGTRELVVRSTYDGLKLAIVRSEDSYSFPTQLSLPFGPDENTREIMRMSPMYREQYY